MGGLGWITRRVPIRWLVVLLPLTLVASVVAGVPARPALAASPPGSAAVRPFTVLASPVPVASGVTVAAGSSAIVPVAGVDGIPPSGVSAVAVRVTVAERTGRGVRKVPNGTVALAPWAPPASPDAGGRNMAVRSAATPAGPPAQLVAYRETGTADGFGLVGVEDGALKVVNTGKAPVTVGVVVEGYAGSGGAVVPLATPRTLSAGATVRAGQRESLAVAGVPAHGVAGLLVELTASAPAAGQLRGAGSGALLDYAAGSSVSALALMSESGGRITLGNDSASAARVSAVVVGYLSGAQAAGGGPLTAVTPAPVTSSPLRVAAHGSVSVPVAGRGGIPAAGVAGAAVGISATLTGSGHSAEVSVGLASSPASATLCPSSAGTCTGFAVTGLSGPALDGVVQVHNFSDRAALVTLSAFGYLSAPTVASAPTALTVRARGGSAVLSWRPPASGGTGITGYAVTVSPGARRLAVSGRKSAVTVPGVSRDVASTFTVAAVNAGGRGAAAEATLVPAGTPAAPGKVSVRADGRGRFLVSWGAAAAHGARVTGYTVTAAPSRVRVAVPASATSAVVTSLAGGAAYVPCVTAASATGATAQSCAGPLLVSSGGAVAQATAVTPGSEFTPVAPVRLMDTRKGLGGVTGPVAATSLVSLPVAGVDGVPSSGVTAVVMNVTVTAPTGGGVLTVYPDGGSAPAVSNLNFSAGETVPNLVTVELGADGKVDFYNNSGGTVQILADLAGYYSASGSSFTPVAPVRLMDTRKGLGGVTGPVAATSLVSLPVAGVDGVPSSGVTAVVMNVTVTAPTGGGVLTVYPDGGSAPAVSNLNFSAGETVPNLVTVELGADGKVDFYNNSGGTVQILADLAGYYVAPLGAPTGVTAAAGNAKATVSWTAPQWDGGSPVTGYTVTASNGASVSAAATATSATVTGLANGTSYTFTVTAANSTGTGPASVASAAVTPSAPPGAPTGVTATAGNGQAAVTWIAPASTGGGAVTSYKVAASPGSATVTVAGTVTTATVTGLTNGTSYTFTVTAATVGGAGPASAASNAVTPATVPGAPTGVTATAGNAQATVTWKPPASNGGSPVTGYTVTASDGATATAAATATSATVTGLTNGTSYTFTVTATNAAGVSAASTASNAVTLTGPPEPPAFTGWTVGNGQVTLDWQAPASDGGEPVTGYTITMEPGGVTHAAAATATSLTVTGLTDGTSYSFSITATSALGTSPASDAVGPVIPITVPGAPTGVTATAASGSATVTWTAPVTEGNEVTGYTVTAAPGGAKVTVPGTASSATVTGLTNGTAYTFTVTTTDAVGTGAASAPSAAVTPGPVPAPPVDVQATTGNATATVSWAAPASAGGSAITSYIVTAVPGGATQTAAGATLTAAFTGLTNNTPYRFTVVAVNSYGDSAPSGSSPSVTPTAPVAPDAPFITNVTSEDSAVAVTWMPPDTGTANITGYTITASAAGAVVSTSSEPATATEATVTGLTDGTQYTFTIAATNATGTGTASPPSTPVAPLPATAPMSPANVIAVPQDGQLQVGWGAPPDGGSPITGYTVTVSPATVSAVSVAGDTTVATVTGLTNGTAYTVSVTATNSAGTSPADSAAPATPAAVIVPGAPVSVAGSVTASGTVSVSWTPPMTPGTAAITGYTVSASTGGNVATTVSASTTACTGTPARCTVSVTGLTATTAYTFTVTATSSAGTSAASAATDAITPTLTVATAPVMLSGADAATLRYIESDGTLIFEQPSSAVTGLTSGQIVYVPATSAAPNGFLGTVDSVTKQGGFVEVTTTTANLADVYSADNTSMDVPFNGADAQLEDALPGVSISRPEVAGRTLTSSAASQAAAPAGSPFGVSLSNGTLNLSLNLDLTQGKSLGGADSAVTASPVAKVEGTVSLTPILHFHLSGGTFSFTIGASLKASIDTKLGLQLQSTQKMELGKVLGPEVTFPVGPILVLTQVVFVFTAVLSTSGTIGIEYSASYSHTLAATCQVGLTGGSASCSSDSTDTSDSGKLADNNEIYGAMSASAGLQIGTGLQIDYIAGPEVDITPQVKLSADTSANPWWTLGLSAVLGVRIVVGEFWQKDEGTTIYNNASLLTVGPLTLAHAIGALTGLDISPGQVSLPAGTTQQFAAYDIDQGNGDQVPATWSVLSGPGTISSSGVFTTPSSPGITIVQATYSGLTGRAGVITGPPLPASVSGSLTDAQGLVDAAVADWAGMVIPAGTTGFAVTAEPDEGPADGTPEVVYAPFTATHAYLPNLSPDVSYTLTVYAYGPAGAGILGSDSGVVPLSPLPGISAGTGNVVDIATNPTTGKPDDTGQAGGGDGGGGAVISGNGEYAFFYTQARSNLAPASIYNPASNDVYLIRKNLFTGVIDVASIGVDGHTPVSVVSPFQPLASDDGSAVVFEPLAGSTAQLEVYDFTSQTSWLVGLPGDLEEPVEGMSANGQVVAYTGSDGHVYRQVAGGTPQEVDACPAATVGSCAAFAPAPSMSADGNLIAYTAQDLGANATGSTDDIYLYNAVTGTDTAVFPRVWAEEANSDIYQTDSYEDPVLSGDGSTLAFQWNGADGYRVVALVKIGSQNKTLIASSTDDSDFYSPIALSESGNVLVYDDANTDPATWWQDKILVYSSGVSQAPQLSAAGNPTTTLATASITDDGSEVLYTLMVEQPSPGGLGSATASDYPGVYLWTPLRRPGERRSSRRTRPVPGPTASSSSPHHEVPCDLMVRG